jgi:hypothetical protein
VSNVVALQRVSNQSTAALGHGFAQVATQVGCLSDLIQDALISPEAKAAAMWALSHAMQSIKSAAETVQSDLRSETRGCAERNEAPQ